MNLELMAGIALLLVWSYIAWKRFARKNAITQAYQREIQNLLTNKKYQVKGRFE
jgi:hypothetical protein